MTTVKVIPKEILNIIPNFNGNKRHLNLFLRKCDYIIEKYRGCAEQDIYVFHAITSKLTDEAAALASERNDISSWDQLKVLLIQHFGDPRSEECIAIELETLKLKQGESYVEFCNRIQSVKSVLISKVNQLPDVDIRKSKVSIYGNLALNVFLYNLPENLIRSVRMKMPQTLEKALEFVLEDVNFYEQYSLRSKMLRPQPPAGALMKFGTPPSQSMPIQPSGFRPAFNTPPRFNFRIPGNSQYRQPFVNKFGQQAPTGYRPQLMQPQQFGMQRFTQPQNFNPRPQQFGYRPQFNQNQFGYKPPNLKYNTDVSMRTAPPLKPQMQTPTQQPQGFRLNELELGENYGYENYESQEGYYYDENDNTDYITSQMEVIAENEQENLVTNETANVVEIENFHILASIKDRK